MTTAPQHGARIECELRSSTETTARYAIVIALPDRSIDAAATLDATARSVSLDAPSDTPPWAVEATRNQLRTLLGDAPAWPKRLHRWRAPR